MGATGLAVALLAYLAGGGRKEAIHKWLRERYSPSIEQAIANVLNELWSRAFDLGAEQAMAALGQRVYLDPSVKQKLLDEFGTAWLKQITDTRLRQIAEAVKGITDPAALEAAVREVLLNQANADLVTITELNRAFQMGAMAVFRAAGVKEVEWVTAGDASVCPACQGNQDAGPRILGTPFPSGAIAPPQHPRCRCVLIPVIRSLVDHH